jgi:hypothetical protein
MNCWFAHGMEEFQLNPFAMPVEMEKQLYFIEKEYKILNNFI